MLRLASRACIAAAVAALAVLPSAHAARAAPASISFSQEIWNANQDVYAAILEHPFLKELTDGSLDRRAFAFYMMQDAHYLRAFGEALKTLALKAPRAEWRALLERDAEDSLQEEYRLHDGVFRDYGISDEDVARFEPSPEATAYSNFLIATAYTRPFHESMAAVLPCYWIYWEVGKTLKARGSKDPVYKRWIDNYASESYGASVRAVLDIVDELGGQTSREERQRMSEQFRRASQYEWMFWDSAYRLQRWPLARP